MTRQAAERGGENGIVSLTVCPYRARAWRDDRLVADSTSALRDEGADRAPVLWFPVADVHGDLLDDGAALTRGAGELDGFVAFDAERVRIELVDSAVKYARSRPGCPTEIVCQSRAATSEPDGSNIRLSSR